MHMCAGVCAGVCVCGQVCVSESGLILSMSEFSLCVLCLCDRLTCSQMVDDEHMNFTSHFIC